MTERELEEVLRQIGVTSGMSLEVHCSFSKLRAFVKDPCTLIDCLTRILTEKGTLIMPGFPLSRALELTEEDCRLGIKSKKRWLDEQSTERSDMGAVADTFRAYPGVLVGQGQHRFSAWGAGKKRAVNDFFSTVRDSHSLLIGVDIHALSALHSVESLIPDALWQEIFPHSSDEIVRRYSPAEWFVQDERNTRYEFGWSQIQKELTASGILKKSTIGTCDCLFFKTSDVVEVYEQHLRQDPRGLFGISPRESEGHLL